MPTEQMPPVSQKCFHCTAACCNDVVLEIDMPEDFEDYDNIRWYLYHNNVFVYLEEEDDEEDDDYGELKWHLGFKTTCGALQPDYSCGVYAKRPQICRDHKADDCSEYTGPGADGDRRTYYDAYFDTAEALDLWLKENNLRKMIRQEDRVTAPKFTSMLKQKKS